MMNWTPKLAVARSRRKLQSAIDHILATSREWEDVDQSYVNDCDDLVREVGELSARIESEVADRLAAGELIGP